MSAFEGWALLELMGHRQRVGLISEVEIAGAKFVRIDIPVVGEEGEELKGLTEFYGGAAIYAIRPCTEEIARAGARQAANPHPVQPLLYRHQAAVVDDADEAGGGSEFDLEEGETEWET